jgi:hypothetical protein
MLRFEVVDVLYAAISQQSVYKNTNILGGVGPLQPHDLDMAST